MHWPWLDCICRAAAKLLIPDREKTERGGEATGYQKPPPFLTANVLDATSHLIPLKSKTQFLSLAYFTSTHTHASSHSNQNHLFTRNLISQSCIDSFMFTSLLIGRLLSHGSSSPLPRLFLLTWRDAAGKTNYNISWFPHPCLPDMYRSERRTEHQCRRVVWALFKERRRVELWNLEVFLCRCLLRLCMSPIHLTSTEVLLKIQNWCLNCLKTSASMGEKHYLVRFLELDECLISRHLTRIHFILCINVLQNLKSKQKSRPTWTLPEVYATS